MNLLLSFYVLFLVYFCCSAAIVAKKPTSPTAASQLKFRTDGTFKIIQFSDTHWNSTEDECQDVSAEQKLYCRGKNTTDFITRALKFEKPDFVVFSGDVVDWDTTDVPKSYAELIGPVISAGIPWALVEGNHECQNTWAHGDRKKVIEVATKMPFSVTQAGPDDIHGAGNYFLQISSSDMTQQLFTIYLMDSGDSSTAAAIDGYDWIWESQLDWYNQTSQALKKQVGRVNPALAFFHIPLREFQEMVLAKTNYTGDMQEEVSSPDVNSGFHTLAVQLGEIISIHNGHDHTNDACGPYHGIQYCYCGGTGYKLYGKEGWPRRGRVLELHEPSLQFPRGHVMTWKVLDVYPEVHTKDMQMLWPATPNTTTAAGITNDHLKTTSLTAKQYFDLPKIDIFGH